MAPPTSHSLCEWAEAAAEIPAGAIHLRSVTPAAGPLLRTATCLMMMTAAHSPVHNGVTFPVLVFYLFSVTVRSAPLPSKFWLLLIVGFGSDFWADKYFQFPAVMEKLIKSCS